jgi:hypothetical protein
MPDALTRLFCNLNARSTSANDEAEIGVKKPHEPVLNMAERTPQSDALYLEVKTTRIPFMKCNDNMPLSLKLEENTDRTERTVSGFTLNVTTEHTHSYTINKITASMTSICMEYWQEEVQKNSECYFDYEDLSLKNFVCCDTYHRFMLTNNTLIGLLNIAGDVANAKPWIMDKSISPIERCYNSHFYFEVKYSSSQTSTYSGWYDRRSVDETSEVWVKFITSLKKIVFSNNAEYLFDRADFVDYPRKSERRFLHIGYKNSESVDLYLQLEQAWIGIGSIVRVTEKDGSQWTGKVDDVLYLKKG